MGIIVPDFRRNAESLCLYGFLLSNFGDRIISFYQNVFIHLKDIESPSSTVKKNSFTFDYFL